MKYLENEELEILKWDELIQKSNYSSPFQTPDFYNFLNNNENTKGIVYAIEVNGKYQGVFVVALHFDKGLKGLISSRAIIYGGPLFTEKNYANLLLQHVVKNIKRKVTYIEVRNFFDYTEFNNIYLKNNFKLKPYLNVILKTTNSLMDEISVKMNKTRARQIRQTIKNGAISKSTNDKIEVKALYDILEDLYRNKVKLPLPDFSFFKSLSYSPVGKVFISMLDGEVIGGAFTLFQENRGIYTYYYCGKEGKYKNVYPTHLALNEVIKYAVDQNLTHVDFMGAGIKGEDYGVRTYKQRFGGETVEYGRYLLISKPLLYRIGKLGLTFLQRLK
jgi:serine/alanine adding enzyme